MNEMVFVGKLLRKSSGNHENINIEGIITILDDTDEEINLKLFPPLLYIVEEKCQLGDLLGITCTCSNKNGRVDMICQKVLILDR